MEKILTSYELILQKLIFLVTEQHTDRPFEVKYSAYYG